MLIRLNNISYALDIKISSNLRTYPMTSILSIIYVYLGYVDRKVMRFAPVMHQ